MANKELNPANNYISETGLEVTGASDETLLCSARDPEAGDLYTTPDTAPHCDMINVG
jgi:hypothetical protein